MSNAPNVMRHEIKLLLSYADYIALAQKLKCVTFLDKYTQENGDYFIRSLYLDDVYNSAYNEKIDGVNNRKKYRIRCYNNSKDIIKFECKYKYNNRIHKVSFGISYEQYQMFMNKDYDFLLEIDHPLAKEVYGLVTYKQLSPSVIVDYDREAYLHRLSNTRLTFDKNLHSGVSSFDIYDENLVTLPTFPNGSVIFEIKYDEFLPAHIAAIISSVNGFEMSLSKYCICKEKLLEVKIYEF